MCERHEVRAVLGLFNACCLLSFRNGVSRTFGRNAANWFTVFQAGQFHIMYYASRTLPNFFAFGLSGLVIGLIYQEMLSSNSYPGPAGSSPRPSESPYC